MASLNFSGMGNQGKAHYRLVSDELDFSYCYIRKNGSSAFKSVFRQLTPESKRVGFRSSLHLMDSLYRVSGFEAEKAKHRIVVLRNPIARFESTIKNKLIQQMGKHDLFTDYKSKTGCDLNNSTIADFFDNYLLGFSLTDLDPHFHSQISHLHPINYNRVYYLDNLHSSMCEIFPAQLANRFFRTKANSSLDEKVVEKPHVDTQYEKETVKSLHLRFVDTGNTPNIYDLLSPGQLLSLKTIYQNDFDLLKEVGFER